MRARTKTSAAWCWTGRPVPASSRPSAPRIVRVADAFYADTWFLTSYELCVGED